MPMKAKANGKKAAREPEPRWIVFATDRRLKGGGIFVLSDTERKLIDAEVAADGVRYEAPKPALSRNLRKAARFQTKQTAEAWIYLNAPTYPRWCFCAMQD